MKKQEDYFMAAKVTDLRSALKMLEDMSGQLIETDVEVEPMAELSGVYRHVGAGRNRYASDQRRTGNDI